MKQCSFGDASVNAGFEKKPLRTRRREFLSQMESVVPWKRLCVLIEPHYPKVGPKGGRPPHRLETMLRIHFLQQWYSYSDPAMEEALHDIPLLQSFTGLDAGIDAIPDESSVLHFRHLLEKHGLAVAMFAEVAALLQARGLMMLQGSIVDATLIAASPSTKNQQQIRDPQMSQTKKGNQWYFGAKAHIGVDANSGLVHTVKLTTAKTADIKIGDELLHGDEKIVFGDGGYHRKERAIGSEGKDGKPAFWTPNKRKCGQELTIRQQGENTALAMVRAKVEHAFRILKCQFGYRKVRYEGLAKNQAQVMTLFMLGNLYQARRSLIGAAG